MPWPAGYIEKGETIPGYSYTKRMQKHIGEILGIPKKTAALVADKINIRLLINFDLFSNVPATRIIGLFSHNLYY